MTPTDPTFDAFERRLADTLTARASSLTAPADGLDRIHTRATHRRRTRRGAWLAAAACLVLVAGIVGVALRSTDEASTPYVDTETGGMPLLGFEGQPMSITSYVPGVLYVVPDSATLDNGVTISFVVWRSDSGYEPGVASIADGQPTTVAGQPATKGGIDAGDGRSFRAVRWEPAPGWKAMLALEESAVDGDADLVLDAAAARIGPADLDAFTAAVEPGAPGPEGGIGHPLPPLVPADGVIGTSLQEVRPSSRLTLTFPGQAGLPGPSALQIRVGEDRTPPPDGATSFAFRGTQAVTYLSDGGDGQPVRILRWTEANDTYVFRMPADLPPEDGIGFARTLRAPTDDEWQSLLFPVPPPPWPGERAFDW